MDPADASIQPGSQCELATWVRALGWAPAAVGAVDAAAATMTAQPRCCSGCCCDDHRTASRVVAMLRRPPHSHRVLGRHMAIWCVCPSLFRDSAPSWFMFCNNVLSLFIYFQMPSPGRAGITEASSVRVPLQSIDDVFPHLVPGAARL
jgi:hypothetical protein